MAPIVLHALTAALAVPPQPGAGGAAAKAQSALPDRGIWPDLDPQVRIAPPSWRLAEGAPWLRLDGTHRLLTVYQGAAPVVAYPLVPGVPGGADRDPRTLAEVLPLLRPGDAEQLRRMVGPGAEAGAQARPEVRPEIRIEHGAPGRAEDRDGDGIVDSLDVLVGAKKLALNKAAYREEYRGMKYPGGDVPRTEGVCTDTLVRALRNAGWDLQREIHEDLLRDPRRYPLEKGKRPDANIDHRRVRMLLPWLQRNFTLVPRGAPLWPGDIVLLDTFPSKSGPDHAGIVSDRLGDSGQPLLVNNWTDGFVEQEMDLLQSIPVTHRFRPRPPR
jgi:uncharacterized protein YijF (DUF1287 family)